MFSLPLLSSLYLQSIPPFFLSKGLQFRKVIFIVNEVCCQTHFLKPPKHFEGIPKKAEWKTEWCPGGSGKWGWAKAPANQKVKTSLKSIATQITMSNAQFPRTFSFTKYLPLNSLRTSHKLCFLTVLLQCSLLAIWALGSYCIIENPS